MAKNERAFRETLMGKFYQIAAGSIGSKGDEEPIKRLLRVLALVQPFNPDDKRLSEAVGVIEGLEKHEVARLIRVISEGGVLFKRGGRYRLSPDLLADAIIEKECIATDGRSTGYAEKVFDAVEGNSLENLIVNLGRLDWRRSDGDPSESRLLDDVWTKLNPQHDYGDPHLKAVAAVAYYQPKRALAFVTSLMRERKLTRKLPEILRYAAYNFRHLKPSCECLWQLGKEDDREMNPHPEHAIRVLREICEVKPDKPRQFIEATVDFGLSLLELPASWTHKHTPLDFVDAVLEPDGHTTSWGGRAMTIENFSVNLGFVRPLRKKLIEKLLALLPRADLPRASLLAARTLHKALRSPMNGANREEWDEEFCETMALIEDVLRGGNLASVVALEVAETVSWHAHYGDGAPKKSANRIIRMMPKSLEFRTTMALVDGYGRLLKKMSDDPSDDLENHERSNNALAEELAQKFKTGDELKAFIDGELSAMASHGEDVESAPRPFLNVLATRCAGFSDAVVREAADGVTSAITRHADIALAALMVQRKSEAMAAVDRLLASGRAIQSGNSRLCLRDFAGNQIDRRKFDRACPGPITEPRAARGAERNRRPSINASRATSGS